MTFTELRNRLDALMMFEPAELALVMRSLGRADSLPCLLASISLAGIPLEKYDVQQIARVYSSDWEW
jgi:hypothetical protein